MVRRLWWVELNGRVQLYLADKGMGGCILLYIPLDLLRIYQSLSSKDSYTLTYDHGSLWSGRNSAAP